MCTCFFRLILIQLNSFWFLYKSLRRFARHFFVTFYFARFFPYLFEAFVEFKSCIGKINCYWIALSIEVIGMRCGLHKREFITCKVSKAFVLSNWNDRKESDLFCGSDDVMVFECNNTIKNTRIVCLLNNLTNAGHALKKWLYFDSKTLRRKKTISHQIYAFQL